MKKTTLKVTKKEFDESKVLQDMYGTIEYVSESGKTFKTSKGNTLVFINEDADGTVSESGRGFVKELVNGCRLFDLGDVFVVTNKYGKNIGQCRTRIEADGIAEEYKYEEYKNTVSESDDGQLGQLYSGTLNGGELINLEPLEPNLKESEFYPKSECKSILRQAYKEQGITVGITEENGYYSVADINSDDYDDNDYYVWKPQEKEHDNEDGKWIDKFWPVTVTGGRIYKGDAYQVEGMYTQTFGYANSGVAPLTHTIKVKIWIPGEKRTCYVNQKYIEDREVSDEQRKKDEREYAESIITSTLDWCRSKSEGKTDEQVKLFAKNVIRKHHRELMGYFEEIADFKEDINSSVMSTVKWAFGLGKRSDKATNIAYRALSNKGLPEKDGFPEAFRAALKEFGAEKYAENYL